MSRDSRVQLITQIEALRSSRVICIVLGDRPALETRLAPDLVPIIGRHLRDIGPADRIDLFLYTTGGDIMSAFRLVALIREYCKSFSVLVPFRCQSAGTLVALGANEICMLAEGQLSPVDPSINGPYNPLANTSVSLPPGMQQPTLPVSVEEVIGFLNLAREFGRIEGQEGYVRIFERLSHDVRPMALGQVFRARTQIRMLSRKLLQMHMDRESIELDGIVKSLTEELYSHDYLISRHEAASLGLKVLRPEPKLDGAILALYRAYESDLSLREPFLPQAQLGTAPQLAMKVDRAFVESQGILDAFQSEFTMARVMTPNGPQVAANVTNEGWRVQT